MSIFILVLKWYIIVYQMVRYLKQPLDDAVIAEKNELYFQR